MPAIPYYDWIAHHAGRRPTKLAIHDLQTGRKFTYADIDHRTDRLAATLFPHSVFIFCSPRMTAS